MTGWACAQVGGGVSLDEACVDWCAGDEPLAMHPLCGAAPEQKGCNAYSSGALPLGTSESVVGVCRGDCVAPRGGLPRHTEGSASRRVQLSVYPSFCLKGLIHDDVVVSGASGREAVEELRRSGALDALFERLDAGEVEMTGSQGLLPALLKEAWERACLIVCVSVFCLKGLMHDE